MNIYEKLQKSRIELQDKQLKKSGENKFANFTYYELGDFIPAANVILNNNKLFSMFNLGVEKATLTIIDCEKTDSTIVFETPIADASIKGCTAIQSLGGTHTYLKRYLYQNALEIVDGDLLDGSLGKEKEDAKYPAKALDQTLLNECQQLSIELKSGAIYLKKDVETLTNDDLKQLIAMKKKALGGNK